MGIKTLSQFYYGHFVDKQEHFISIDEGAGEIIVNLTPSGYTFFEQGVELQRALNASLVTQVYTVTTDRSTRKYTISAPSNFSILAGTGAYAGSLAYTQLGLNIVDKTGANSYVSDFSTGTVYRPQLPFFSYAPSNLREGSIQATQDESGSGAVQVVSFGSINIMEADIKYVTNRKDKPDIIEYDADAVESCMQFLSYLRQKNRVEFMPDRDDPDTFERLLLTKSSVSGTGLEVKLSEMSGIQDYYETNPLTFRVIT